MSYKKQATLVFEYRVSCVTPTVCPSLPACVAVSQLPDFTQHSGLEEDTPPLLNNNSSNSRMLFSKTMQQKHLLHASTRKLQDDMKDNMRRYTKEKARLQEQLASLRHQMDDLNSEVSYKSDQLNGRELCNKKSKKTEESIAYSEDNRNTIDYENSNRGIGTLNYSSQAKSNNTQTLKAFPRYLPKLDHNVRHKATKKLVWDSGKNLGNQTTRRTSKLPPLPKNLITKASPRSNTSSFQYKDRSNRSQRGYMYITPDVHVLTPDEGYKGKSPEVITSQVYGCNAHREEEDTEIIPELSGHPVKPVPTMSPNPADDCSGGRNGSQRLPAVPHLLHITETVSSDPSTQKQHKCKTTPKTTPRLFNASKQPKQKKFREKQNALRGKNKSDSHFLPAINSVEKANNCSNEEQNDPNSSRNALTIPSITLRPASKTGELDRLRSFLNAETPTLRIDSKTDFKPRDPTRKWKALYLKITDPQKRLQMLADIVFGVRSKMRENEHQLKFGESPEDLVTKSTLCDFLLFKPLKTNKAQKAKTISNRAIPNHTALRAGRKSNAAQLQHYLQRSVKGRPMIEHLQAEEYRLTRYGRHKYLLTDGNK